MYLLVSAQPYEQILKASRFRAELLSVESAEGVKTALAAQRAKYSDASHVVHAMSVGHAAEIVGCSDDGEPSGTAGRPVLEVLKGSQVTNVLLTVTRWFGGTKLGTGGLVRAYSSSAQGVLAAAVLREIIAMSHFAFTLPFPLIDPGKRLLAELGFTIASESWIADGDALSGDLPADRAPQLMQRLADLSRGKIRLAPPQS